MKWVDKEFALVYLRAAARKSGMAAIFPAFFAALVALSMVFNGFTLDGFCVFIVFLAFALAFHFTGIAMRAAIRDMKVKTTKRTR